MAPAVHEAPADSPSALLTLEGVSKSFGGVAAVRDVDLTVAHGEILGLIGPNGSGKTTLFNVVTGIHRADAGQVRLKGHDITAAGPHDINRLGIARTFQLVRPFPNLSVLQNVAVGRAYGRDPAHSRHQAELEALGIIRQAGLQVDPNVRAGSLTLVDRKRLELARALATRPHLLLLDELLAGFNPSEVNQGLDLIRRIRDSGVTVVMVEHLVQAVMSVCDRIVVMSVGEKIADGRPDEVARDKHVIDAYLGVAANA